MDREYPVCVSEAGHMTTLTRASPAVGCRSAYEKASDCATLGLVACRLAAAPLTVWSSPLTVDETAPSHLHASTRRWALPPRDEDLRRPRHRAPDPDRNAGTGRGSCAEQLAPPLAT